MVTTEQELILTENTRSAEAASWRQFGGPAPCRPCRLQVHLSTWSLGHRPKGVGSRLNSGRRVAGRTVCESTRHGSRKGFISPSPGCSQGLFSFLSLILFHSHRPPKWVITACALQRRGSRNVWTCFCTGPAYHLGSLSLPRATW